MTLAPQCHQSSIPVNYSLPPPSWNEYNFFIKDKLIFQLINHKFTILKARFTRSYEHSLFGNHGAVCRGLKFEYKTLTYSP